MAWSRAINIWIDADRLAAYKIPVTAVREAVDRQNAEHRPAATSPTSSARTKRCARWAASRMREGASTSWSSPRAMAHPSACATSAAAEDGTKEQRSVRPAQRRVVTVITGCPPPVGREHRRRHRRREGKAGAAVRAQLPGDVKLEVIRDQSRYIYEALARDQQTPRARQHPRVPRRAGVHAELARHGHRGRGHSRPRWWPRSA